MDGDQRFIEYFNLISGGKNVFYYLDCYKTVTNKTNLECYEKRFENKGKELSHETTLAKKNFTQITEITEIKLSKYFFQVTGGKLRKVEVIKTGENMLRVAQKLKDNQFFLQLNTIPKA